MWYSSSYKDFCCHYDNSAFKNSTLTVPCSSVISSHTTCVPHPSHLFKRVMVKWNALDTVQGSHTYEMNWTLRVNHTQARIRSPSAGVPKFGPGGPVSLQNLAPTLIKHWISHIFLFSERLLSHLFLLIYLFPIKISSMYDRYDS